MASTATTVVNVGGVDYELRFLDLLPRVDDETFTEMEADILANKGFRYRIQAKKLTDDMGNKTVLVVDGNHRVLIAKKLGLPVLAEFPKEFQAMTDEQLEERAWSLNRKRRHLSSEELAQVAAKMEAKGLSRRAAAKKIGVPESTLRAASKRCIGAQDCAPIHPPNPMPDRRERVRELAEEGTSLRKIATEVGVSLRTVQNDLAALAAPDPEPASDGIDPEDGEQLEIEGPPAESGDEWLARQQERVARLTESNPEEDDDPMLCDVCEQPCGDRTFSEGSWIGECCSSHADELAPVAKHKEVTKPVASEKKASKATKSTAAERALDRQHGTGKARAPKAKTVKKEPKPEHPFHDLELDRWKELDVFSGSMWRFGARAKGEGRDGSYHGNFIPQVPDQILRRYTRRGDIVLDMFTGSGTTLVECLRLGRHFIGVELQKKMVQHCNDLANSLPNPHNVRVNIEELDSTEPKAVSWVAGMARDYGRTPPRVDHVIMHPPYWNIIRFSEDPRCLSNTESAASFAAHMRAVAVNAFHLLEPGKWATLIIGDVMSDGILRPLDADCIPEFETIGFELKARFIKDIQGNEKGKGQNANLWRRRALEHGFAYFEHEYILAFRKPLGAK